MKKNIKIIVASILILLMAAVGGLWFLNTNKPLDKKFVVESQNKTTNVLSQQQVSLVSAATNLVTPVFSSLTNTAKISPAKTDGQISANALKQIAALEKEKGSRTPTQQKIDTQLLYADKMRRGVPVADGVSVQRVDLDKDDQGRVLVDIKASVTDALLQHIKTLGGNVVNDFPQYQAIRAGIPLAEIENLAARSEVKFVEPAVRAMNNTVDSQGDYTHQANTARTTFGVNGMGVKVGVLSDSVDYLTTSQIAGKVTVLSGQSGEPNTGEGTAMLEIVNDLAPGAQLYFATAGSGEASFANNIQQLYADGCNIIVDDESYSDESPFQDGIVAQAVNSATANGVLYFSSAGNSGNKDDGTSGTWEGDFSDGGQTLSPLETGRIHNFSTGINANTCQGGTDLRADLFWSDPLDASSNDYDLYVLNSSGTTVIASSLNTQNGSQDPYESVGTITNGELIVIVKYSGAGRFLHLSTGRGLLSINTQGSTRGHDCATNAFDVAATSALNSYPNAFSGGAANPVETFSSDGPRRVFFQANGTPITPGNFSSSGGAVRQKPDIAAADGVTTDLPSGGLNPFYGTSAAAPHAGAIAALLKSYNTNLTASLIRTVLTNTALDIMSPGVDRDSGAGLVMALPALEATPLPNLARFTDNLNNLSPHTGDVVTASITITNQPCSDGGTSAGAFHVGFYFSSSSSFAGAAPFYEAAVSGCVTNGTALLNQNISISAGVAPGVYYLGYKIDDENEVTECNEGDNGIFYWTITILPPPQANLTKSADNLNNSSPHPGDTIMTSLTITNGSCTGGSANAGIFHVGFYGLSTTTSFTGLTPFYELQVNGCTANGTVSTNLNIIINAATTPGTYYLGYKIDDENEIAECNEGDNGINYWILTVVSSNTTPPTISITSPTSAATYLTSVNSINLGGTASDNIGVTQVTWSNNRGGSGAASGMTAWTVSGATLQTGANVITLTAHDAAGNTGQAVLTATYNPQDTTPPTISITSPTGVATYNTFSNNINLNGTSSDNVGVTQVTWSNNRGGSGTASGTAAWSVTGIALQNSTNIITLTAYDAAGNSGNAALTVTYNPLVLGIVNQRSNILLTWPTNAVGFMLEYATNLPANSWTTNSSSSFIVNGQNTVTNTISNTAKFYRLIKP